MITEGAREIVGNTMHARIPNGLVPRNCWINLCIDVQSFVNDCFYKETTTNQYKSTELI